MNIQAIQNLLNISNYQAQLVAAAGVLLLSFILYFITKNILLKVILKLSKKTKTLWDDKLMERKVFDNSYAQEMNLNLLRDFLYRIKTENIIILIDSYNQIKSQYIDFLKTAKNKMIQIRILFEEILKIAKRKLIQVPYKEAHFLDTIHKMNTELKPDSVIISNKFKTEKKHLCEQYTNVLDLNNYIDSNIEEKRLLFSDFPPLDENTKTINDEAFIRSFKFSKSILFFDKQMCKAAANGQRLNKFYNGISYVLDLAKTLSVNLEVEIYSCFNRKLVDSELNSFRQIWHTDIINKIEQDYNIKVKVIIKLEDPPNTFHSRHIVTDYCFLLIERGLDFLKQGNTFKKSFLVNQVPNAASHISGFRDSITLYEFKLK